MKIDDEKNPFARWVLNIIGIDTNIEVIVVSLMTWEAINDV